LLYGPWHRHDIQYWKLLRCPYDIETQNPDSQAIQQGTYIIVPTMTHMQTKAESYKFFGSSLVSLDDEPSNIPAFGSDRDATLRKAFLSFFPIATS